MHNFTYVNNVLIIYTFQLPTSYFPWTPDTSFSKQIILTITKQQLDTKHYIHDFNYPISFSRLSSEMGANWHRLVIQATREAEVRRLKVQGLPGQQNEFKNSLSSLSKSQSQSK